MNRPRAIIVLLLLCANFLHSQSAYDYYSTDGLSINSIHHNFFEGESSNSFSFKAEKSLCGRNVLEYISNDNGYLIYLYITGQQVFFMYPNDCSLNLLYDYSLEVGDIVPNGFYKDLEILSKSDVTLLNGEVRKQYELGYELPSIYGKWVVGLGDVLNGLVPLFYDFEGYDMFVCARVDDEVLWMGENIEEEICNIESCRMPFINIELSEDDLSFTVVGELEYVENISWDFGDGNSSTDKYPSHTYDSKGCYEIQLTFDNECGIIDSTISFQVNACHYIPWQEEATLGSSNNVDIHFYNENLGFLENDKLFYKTVNGGKNWTLVTLPLPDNNATRFVTDLVMIDEMVGFISLGHYNGSTSEYAILKTIDGGDSWTEIGIGTYFLSGIVYNPELNRLIGVGQYRFYYSDDLGENWTSVETSNNFDVQYIQHISGNLYYGSGYQYIAPQGKYYFAKSIDGGITWENVNENIQKIKFYNANIGLGSFGYDLFLTTNAGLDWELINVNGERVRDWQFINESSFFVGTYEGSIFKTNDLGVTIIEETCSSDFPASSFHVFDDFIIAAARNKVLKYKPNGDTDCEMLSTNTVEESQITIYPNPTNGQISIKTTETINNITITDISGRIIEVDTRNAEYIDVSELGSGIYLMSIELDSGKALYEKFIKN